VTKIFLKRNLKTAEERERERSALDQK